MLVEKPVTFEQLQKLLYRDVFDLEEQEQLFAQQVMQTNAWDKVLRANEQKVGSTLQCQHEF